MQEMAKRHQNQSANIGIVKLDDTARKNMTPSGLEMKVHLGNEQKAFLGDFCSSSNEVSKLLVNSTVVVHSEGNKFGTVISCV